MNQLVSIRSATLPALVAAAGERASMRFLEFLAANIRNSHTRRAYARAAEEFLAWCAAADVPSIAAVQAVHVATWIEAGTRELAAPSVKQRLAAIRYLFDWLVTGQVLPVTPAGSVRGSRHVVTSGQTPVLDPAEARGRCSTASILRASPACAIARSSSIPRHDSRGVYTQNRRLWVRLREKGGKGHAMPCHHNLEEYLTAYLDGADLRGDSKGPLFRTIGRGTGKLTRTVLPQANAYAMIGRRAAAVGIATRLSNTVPVPSILPFTIFTIAPAPGRPRIQPGVGRQIGERQEGRDDRQLPRLDTHMLRDFWSHSARSVICTGANFRVL